MNRTTLPDNRLFDFDFLAGWIKIPKCVNCSLEFTAITRKSGLPVYRRPLLLECLHSICECCCWKKIGPIKCNKCQAVTVINKQRPVRESIEYNYYLYGMLSYVDHILRSDEEYANGLAYQNRNTDQHECSECNKEKTNQFCVQCAVPYCKSCFKAVHKFGKALRKHRFALLGSKESKFSKIESKICLIHRKGIFHYCVDCKEACCVDCLSLNHKTHSTKSIAEENPKLLPKIKSLVETLKSAKEYNRQAQKDARFIEKKQEEYAAKAVNEVSNYFLNLHATLQLIQRNILLDIKKHSSTLLIQTKQAQDTLKKSLETIEEISSNLENVLINCPVNYLLSDIIEHTNTILESTPCDLKFEGCDESPFQLEELGDPLVDFKKLNKFNFNAGEFSIKIKTFFGDISLYPEDDILANKLEELSIDLNLNKTSAGISGSANSSNAIQTLPITVERPVPNESVIMRIKKRKHLVPPLSKYNTEKVHVSHITNPELFYVQKQNFLDVIEEFKSTCTQEGDFGSNPETIKKQEIYLVFNTIDRDWYRGRIVSTIKPDLYKVFLIDFGNTMEVPKQRFHSISDDLKSKTPGAVKCSLYGIKPKEKKWKDEARQLMSDIIKTEVVSILTIKEGDPQLVEILATHLQYPTPVRDTLVFHNLANEDTVNQEQYKIISQISELTRNSLITNTSRYYKNVFKERESFRGIVTNVINPQEFYVAKYDHKIAMDDLYEKLNEDYQKPYEKIYYPQENMICAVFLEGIWYRAIIKKILEKGECRVWLVDHGKTQVINSRHIRVLDEKYISANECVIQCSLIDIEPLPENDYSWTEASIEDFKRFIQNPKLLIFIHHSKDFHYKVAINVSKKHKDVNINALLVKHKHAVSTGMESKQVDFPKMEDVQDSGSAEHESFTKNKSNPELRTTVKITCIVSPGEFYININQQIPGIVKIHEELQAIGEAENTDSDSMTIEEKKLLFKEDSNCIAKVPLKKDSAAEWYRARILDIIEIDGNLQYKIFLRDNGKVISNIPFEKIAPIKSEYDRICNGAIKCHMACVQPTGGIDKWSASSTDEFRLILNNYEAISISRQGEYCDSFPTIVWGLTSECCDPFAPNINKWYNINKLLVNRGLLHLVEKFATVMKSDICVDNEGLERHNELMSINEWADKFNKTKITEELNETFECYEMTNELETITKWIPPILIEKTIFIGIPTYVDEQAIIYLHDAQQEKNLEKIKSVINGKLSGADEAAHEFYWYAGQPCLARYHADNLFYRALVIQNLPEKIIQVQFIDYGNVEECSMSDLRKDIMLGSIPIQATKFTIAGIRPKNASKWPTDSLDFIHKQVVNKSCSVRVSPNQEDCEIKQCSLKVKTDDIAELLIEMNIADRGSSQYKYSQITNTILKKTEDENDFDIGVIYDSQVKESDILDSDKLRNYFEQKEISDLYNSINVIDNSSDSDCGENLDFTFRSGYWESKSVNLKMDSIKLCDEDDEPDSSLNSFNPPDTSSVKSQLSQTHIMNLFKTTIIPQETKAFYCEVTYIKDPLNFFICPLIPEHVLKQKEMTKEIQIHGRIGHRFKDIESNAPCLAIYHEDSLWYRALFRSYCQDIQKLDVIFVDFLNAEKVDPSMVKKCPQSLLEYPLRNIQVRLSKVKINTRWRTSDVQKQMVEALSKSNKVYVKIIKNRTIPEVELYSSQDDTEVIYEDLITNKFLLSEK